MTSLSPSELDKRRAALEEFVFDNPDLERLEAILDDFNPFVVLRWSHQELRHSGFLRWLLDPSKTHGLGSYFLGILG
jgi:PD-(D/E)XK nuclease superfamily protein